jgi:pimeloyl-ACP methyl ester carboxylesterase
MKYFVPLNILPSKHILTQKPILYISGDDDKYLHVNKHREVFDELLASTSSSSTSHPNVKMEFKVINECGHLPQDEKPQEVLNTFIEFLLSLQI